jgi:tetratricopeptide (TPR) repeat protein
LVEVKVAEGWILYAEGKYEETMLRTRQAIESRPDCEGAYYLLGRALFAAGRFQEVVEMADAAKEASGDDYNIYVPILNAMGAMGKAEAHRNLVQQRIEVLESHLREVPEDARARTLLATDYAVVERVEDAVREANLAVALRPNEGTVLYNAACVFCHLNKKPEALDALRKAWEAGFKDPDWARRDPELALVHGDPEFEKLYPESPAGE